MGAKFNIPVMPAFTSAVPTFCAFSLGTAMMPILICFSFHDLMQIRHRQYRKRTGAVRGYFFGEFIEDGVDFKAMSQETFICQ